MGDPDLLRTAEELARRASALREALERSQRNTDSMVSALGSVDHRLSAIESTLRPTQVRTHAIQMALGNIDRTMESADAILAQLEIARRCFTKFFSRCPCTFGTV